MKQRDIKKLPPEEALDAWFAKAVALAKKYGVTAGFVVGVVHSPNVGRLFRCTHFGSGETDEFHRRWLNDWFAGWILEQNDVE